MSSRIPIDPVELKELYVGQGMTINEVAGALGVSYSTARKNLIREGIQVRPSGFQAIQVRRSKEWAKHDPYVIWLREGLLLSFGQMEKFLGCSKNCATHAYRRAVQRRTEREEAEFLRRVIDMEMG